MKTKFTIILVTLFSTLTVFGQQELSREQVLEDYTIFKDILTSGHPSLYEYTSKVEWDSIFSVFEQEGIKGIKNSDDLFRSVNTLADFVKDGHFTILHPKIETVSPMFPLLLKIIDEKLYTDTDDFGIPLGSEVISIDATLSQTILLELLKYAPSDGYNLTKRYRQIEKEFEILHYYEYGNKASYSVKYIAPDAEVKTIEIAPRSFDNIGERYVNRSSHFASYHQNPNPIEHFKTRIAEKWPFIYYIDSCNTAVLTVNSFGLDPQEFKSRLIDLFKEVNKKKVSSLIIDVRQNIGGYRINAINLFSFITDEPFKQRVSESAITDELPMKEYSIHAMSNYDEFFEMYFATAKKENERWVLEEDHAQAEMIPYKKPFKGEVYVLIGGNTFSAGSAFALSAKNSSQITLVGQETGGGYYFHTGQYPVLYELPNSKVIVRMSLVKVDKYVLDTSIPKGSGVLPDIEVSLTVRDLIEGKDSELDYIVNKISTE